MEIHASRLATCPEYPLPGSARKDCSFSQAIRTKARHALHGRKIKRNRVGGFPSKRQDCSLPDHMRPTVASLRNDWILVPG